MSLLAELKRRNVIRMAGLYLIGAWLIVQVVGTVLPMFHAPEWLPQSVVALLAIGFIPAMVFAWVFEMTPDGLKRDAEVDPAESIAPQTAKRMNRMIMAVLVLALTYFAFDRLVLAPRRDAALVATTTQTVQAKATAKAKPTVDRNSIAVLPFVNMSGDPANEYFSDGISEEILNVLAGTPELKVAARTSSFSFKGKAMEVPEIARVLNVRMVLEGSVRKQGDKVRITAQLIDASNGFHVWSQTFDRKLEDIFAIQDEIARAIGDELKVKIGGGDGPGQRSSGTKDLAAYDLYLRGMSLWHTRRENALWEAVALFEQAAAADPTFAQAYAGQALVYGILPSYSARISWTDGLARSNEHALRALALDPTLPEPYAAFSQGAINTLHRATSIALARRAIALRPSFATAHQWLGNSLLTSGDLAGSLASMERASALDPRAPVIADNHAFTLLAHGRIADAKARCEQALAYAPTHVACLQYVGMADLLLGNLVAARPMLERLAAEQNPGARGQAQDLVEALAGRTDRHALALTLSKLALNSQLDPDSGNALEDQMVAMALMMLDEHALALDYIERIAGDLGNTMDWAIMLPAMDPIRCEPHFIAVVKQLKTTDPHFAKVCAGES